VSYQHLEISTQGNVTSCSIANPPHHTLTAMGVQELHALLDSIEADDSIRAVILTGGGEGVFISHYEVAELAAEAEAENPRTAPRSQPGSEPESGPRKLHPLHRLCLRLEALNIPTLAAVNGNAGGGGCELALACDFRLLCDGPYHFGLPETNVGIIPGAGGTQRFTRLLGVARALDLILHGKRLSPHEAFSLGLAHRVFAGHEFSEQVDAFAANLASRSPIALAQAKRAIRDGADLPLVEGLHLEQACFDQTMRSRDAAGAMRAWLRNERWEWTGE
jgi:enoyl-CoA hydratase